MSRFIGNILRFQDPEGVLPYWEFPQTLNAELGAQRVEFLGHHELFPADDLAGEGWIDERKAAENLRAIRQPSVVMLDLEGPNRAIRPNAQQYSEFYPETAAKLLRIMEFAREHSHPQTRLAFYDQQPQSSVSSIFGHNGSGPAKYTRPVWRCSWHERHLQMRTLAAAQDCLMPCLYYTSRMRLDVQIRYTEEMLDEARMFRRPVYPVFWYCWKHQGQYVPMPVDRYRLLLRLTLEMGDGVILWSENKNDPWNPSAEWWTTCRELIQEFQAKG